MTSHPKARWIAILLAACLVPMGGHTQDPSQPNRAGQITALLPVDFVVRQQTQLEAAKDMALLWRDLINTGRGGRVRARLDDGTVLNVGAESSLLVLEHDAQIQRTELELMLGRLRARVVRIARPGGKFEVRTPTAAIGVMGTDLYVESSASVTTVIALGGGRVTAQSADPQFPEVFTLDPGELAIFVKGQRPARKRLASVGELVRALESTLVDSLDALASAAAIRGHGLVTLADDTAFEALLSKTLDSRNLKPGDRVEARTARAVKSGGEVVLEQNARLIGRVTQAQARARGAQESALGIVFEKAVLRDGREVPLAMSLQAIASAQTAVAANTEWEQPPLNRPSTASRSGGLVGGVTSTAGRTAGTVADTTRDVTGRAGVSADAAARTSSAAGVALNRDSTGVLGLPGLTLQAESTTAAEGSLLTSNGSTVRLNSGTRLLLRVSSPHE